MLTGFCNVALNVGGRSQPACHVDARGLQDWTVGWHTYETRWDDLIYRKDGMPLVGFTRVQDMPHATTIEMSRRI